MCSRNEKNSYKDRLVYLNLETLEKRWVKYDLTEVFKIVKKLSAIDFNKLFTFHETSIQSRGHRFKLNKEHGRHDFRKYFFSNRIIEAWNNF